MHNHKHPSSAYARILFRHLRLGEKNSQAYFAGTAVTYDELMTLDGTIPRHDLIRIYRNALAISDREDIGLSVGTQFQLSAHGPLGVATFNSADLLSGLNLLAKFGQTRTDFFNISVNEHIDGVQVEFTETFDLGDLRVFVTEATLSGFFSAITFFTGHKTFSGEIRLVYTHYDRFYNCDKYCYNCNAYDYSSHHHHGYKYNHHTDHVTICDTNHHYFYPKHD